MSSVIVVIFVVLVVVGLVLLLTSSGSKAETPGEELAPVSVPNSAPLSPGDTVFLKEARVGGVLFSWPPGTMLEVVDVAAHCVLVKDSEGHRAVLTVEHLEQPYSDIP